MGVQVQAVRLTGAPNLCRPSYPYTDILIHKYITHVYILLAFRRAQSILLEYDKSALTPVHTYRTRTPYTTSMHPGAQAQGDSLLLCLSTRRSETVAGKSGLRSIVIIIIIIKRRSGINPIPPTVIDRD